MAEKYGMTPSELALAWCDSRWFVASTIIGATSLDQLKVLLHILQRHATLPQSSPCRHSATHCVSCYSQVIFAAMICCRAKRSNDGVPELRHL